VLPSDDKATEQLTVSKPHMTLSSPDLENEPLLISTAIACAVIIARAAIITCAVIIPVIFHFAVSIARVPGRVGTDIVAATLITGIHT
jgi:hypothetical protein